MFNKVTGRSILESVYTTIFRILFFFLYHVNTMVSVYGSYYREFQNNPPRDLFLKRKDRIPTYGRNTRIGFRIRMKIVIPELLLSVYKSLP